MPPLSSGAYLPAQRALRPRPAGPLARLLAQLRRRPRLRVPARDRPPRVRPRHHPPRPRQQLRASLRRRRDQLRPADEGGLPPLPRRDGDLDQGRLGHVARALRPGRRRASTCSPRSTSRCARLGLDHVDIFYSHRLDGSTRWRRRWARSTPPVRQGKALYVGISSYDAEHTREAAAILADLGTPLLIHQPSYSMLNRWIEDEGLLEAADELGVGVIAFTASRPGPADREIPGRGSRRTRGARSRTTAPSRAPGSTRR